MSLGTGTCGETNSGTKPGRWNTSSRAGIPVHAEEDLGVTALFETEEAEELDSSGASDSDTSGSSD